MVKYFCDCCNRELDGRYYEIPIMKHIVEQGIDKIMSGHFKMIDGEMHSISGVIVNKQLCLPCYNKIMYRITEEFENLKSSK